MNKIGIWIVWQYKAEIVSRADAYLDVDDVEGSWVTVTGLDDTNTASVTTTGDHAKVARVELDVLGDGTGLDVKDDGVVNLDVRGWVADGAGVVGNDEWDTLNIDIFCQKEWLYLLGNADLGDLAELVACLLGGDAVNGEASLDIVDEAEGLVGLLDGDDIHESGGEGGVTSDFAVDFYQIVLIRAKISPDRRLRTSTSLEEESSHPTASEIIYLATMNTFKSEILRRERQRIYQGNKAL